MRKRWLVGTLVVLSVLALAGRVVTLAQKPESPKLIWDSVPAGSKQTQPKGWRAAGDPLLKTANGTLPPAEPAADDPMGAVETFLQKNQKEADDSIKALTQEAEALQARLQKVETALGRWKGVAQALDQQAKSGADSPPPVAQETPVLIPPPIPPSGDTSIPPQPVSSPPDPPSLPNSIPPPSPNQAPSLPELPPKTVSKSGAPISLPHYMAYTPKRVAELVVDSENLRKAGDEWDRFWFLDQPSHMTPFRTHGGLGP